LLLTLLTYIYRFFEESPVGLYASALEHLCSSDVVGVPTHEFRRVVQDNDWSCGACSVHMVLRHFGVTQRYRKTVRDLGSSPAHGTNVGDMIAVLRDAGLRVGYRPNLGMRRLCDALSNDAVVLVHLDGDHFGVVHGADRTRVYLADPSIIRMPGRRMEHRKFLQRWTRWGLVVRAA
jgi:predicted double-glycine peptidase